jgi:hypothetical protein
MGKVEAGRVGDRLQVVGRAEVVVAAGNRRMLTDGEARDGLREGVAEVGVLRVAAIARPEAGVDGELHQVGEPSDLLGAGRLAAGQRAELVQIDCLRAVRAQVSVQEGEVAELVVGVVVDVLVHVLVQHRDSLGVGRVPGSAGNFTVLDAGELVVLLPQIGLENLGRSQEPENRRVPPREPAVFVVGFVGLVPLVVLLAGEGRRPFGHQPGARSCGSCRGPCEQERTTAGRTLLIRSQFHDPLPARRHFVCVLGSGQIRAGPQ